MRSERFEQGQHLLVGSTGPAGEVPHHNVFQMEVSDRDGVSISVTDGNSFCRGPLPNTLHSLQICSGLGRRDTHQLVDADRVTGRSSNRVGASLFDA
jgi:hypothetical protein